MRRTFWIDGTIKFSGLLVKFAIQTSFCIRSSLVPQNLKAINLLLVMTTWIAPSIHTTDPDCHYRPYDLAHLSQCTSRCSRVASAPVSNLLSGNNTDLNINLRKYVPQIQHALLTNILPTWDTLLHQDQSSLLVKQYFYPDAVYNVRPVAGEIALCGYATLDQ